MIKEMIRYALSCVLQSLRNGTLYLRQQCSGRYMCVPVVSGCVSVSRHVNETWSVVLVSLGSGTMCDVASYRTRALRKVMSLRVGGQQLFSLAYSRNGIPLACLGTVSITIGALVCGMNSFTRGLSMQSLDRTFEELRVAVCALVCFGFHSGD